MLSGSLVMGEMHQTTCDEGLAVTERVRGMHAQDAGLQGFPPPVPNQAPPFCIPAHPTTRRAPPPPPPGYAPNLAPPPPAGSPAHARAPAHSGAGGAHLHPGQPGRYLPRPHPPTQLGRGPPAWQRPPPQRAPGQHPGHHHETLNQALTLPALLGKAGAPLDLPSFADHPALAKFHLANAAQQVAASAAGQAAGTPPCAGFDMPPPPPLPLLAQHARGPPGGLGANLGAAGGGSPTREELLLSMAGLGGLPGVPGADVAGAGANFGACDERAAEMARLRATLGRLSMDTGVPINTKAIKVRGCICEP